MQFIQSLLPYVTTFTQATVALMLVYLALTVFGMMTIARPTVNAVVLFCNGKYKKAFIAYLPVIALVTANIALFVAGLFYEPEATWTATVWYTAIYMLFHGAVARHFVNKVTELTNEALAKQ